MTLEDAFLRAILDEPGDDFPRLAYADWLQERGDARGEFIHLQCRLARPPAGDPGRAEMEARQRELLARHGDDWLRAECPVACRGVFRRGFLDEVAVPVADYLHDEPTPPPTVRRVEVDLTDFTVPVEVIEFMPEGVARENVALPVAFRGPALVIALPDPPEAALLQRFEFIFNRPVEAVVAPREQIIEAINRHYGQYETESVVSILYEFVDVDRRPGEGHAP